MSRPSALRKLSRAARLSAKAARLYAEATAELSKSQEKDDESAEPPPPITEMDRARARRALRKLGART